MPSRITERFRHLEHKLRTRLIVSIVILIALVAPPIFSLVPHLNEHLRLKSIEKHRARAERIVSIIDAESTGSLVPKERIEDLFSQSLLSDHGSLVVMQNGEPLYEFPARPNPPASPPLGGKYTMHDDPAFNLPGHVLHDHTQRKGGKDYRLVFLAESIPYSVADRLARFDILNILICFSIGLGLIYWTHRSSLRLARSQHELAMGIAHEIRTPLASMRLYAEMLADGVAQGAEQRAGFERSLRDGTEKLSHVVDRLLSAGDAITLQRVSVEKIAEAARAEIQQFVSQQSLHLSVQPLAGSRGASACNIDLPSVLQILLIFADNAAKHGTSAANRTISLGVSVKRRFLTRRLTLSIQDAGAQNSTAPCRAVNQGLGLKIAKQIARPMGGIVSLKRSGPGHIASLSLPLNTRPHPA